MILSTEPLPQKYCANSGLYLFIGSSLHDLRCLSKLMWANGLPAYFSPSMILHFNLSIIFELLSIATFNIFHCFFSSNKYNSTFRVRLSQNSGIFLVLRRARFWVNTSVHLFLMLSMFWERGIFLVAWWEVSSLCNQHEGWHFYARGLKISWFHGRYYSQLLECLL